MADEFTPKETISFKALLYKAVMEMQGALANYEGNAQRFSDGGGSSDYEKAKYEIHRKIYATISVLKGSYSADITNDIDLYGDLLDAECTCTIGIRNGSGTVARTYVGPLRKYNYYVKYVDYIMKMLKQYSLLSDAGATGYTNTTLTSISEDDVKVVNDAYDNPIEARRAEIKRLLAAAEEKHNAKKAKEKKEETDNERLIKQNELLNHQVENLRALEHEHNETDCRYEEAAARKVEAKATLARVAEQTKQREEGRQRWLKQEAWKAAEVKEHHKQHREWTEAKAAAQRQLPVLQKKLHECDEQHSALNKKRRRKKNERIALAAEHKRLKNEIANTSQVANSVFRFDDKYTKEEQAFYRKQYHVN